jgi:hypothetical protein
MTFWAITVLVLIPLFAFGFGLLFAARTVWFIAPPVLLAVAWGISLGNSELDPIQWLVVLVFGAVWSGCVLAGRLTRRLARLS